MLMVLTELTLEGIESNEWIMKLNIPFFDFTCKQLFFLLPHPAPPPGLPEAIATT